MVSAQRAENASHLLLLRICFVHDELALLVAEISIIKVPASRKPLILHSSPCQRHGIEFAISVLATQKRLLLTLPNAQRMDLWGMALRNMKFVYYSSSVLPARSSVRSLSN